MILTKRDLVYFFNGHDDVFISSTILTFVETLDTILNIFIKYFSRTE